MSTNRRQFLRGSLTLLAGGGAAVACAHTEDAPTPAATPEPLPTPARTEFAQVYQDLAYAAPVGRGHLLDLYLPLDHDGPVPVVIHQVGSAFRSDDTKGDALSAPEPLTPGGMVTAPQLAALWAPRGYAVVGLNVRNSSQVTFPGQVHDAKAAIRYLRSLADRCGLDTDRFATMGNSSGGWVAAMTAVTVGLSEFEGDLGHPEQSSAVHAAVDLYGPTDFLQMDAHRLADGQLHDAADSPESELMGFPIQSDPAAVEKANPARYVRAGSPPMWLTHGMRDTYVPFNQSEILFDAYAGAGASATLTLVPDAGHADGYLMSPELSAEHTVHRTANGTTSTGSDPAPTFDAILDFLNVNLGV